MKTRLTHMLRPYIALSLLTVCSCQNDHGVVPGRFVEGQKTTELLKSELTPLFFQDLPRAVRDQLRLTREKLDEYLQGELQITDIQILGSIPTEESARLSCRTVTDKDNVIAFGNITDPGSVHVGPMRNVYSPKKLSATRNQIEKAASREIKPGDNVMEITWRRGKETYKTQCFYRDTGIVWDNILSGLVMMDIERKPGISGRAVSQREDDPPAGAYYRWYKRWWAIQ